MWSVMVHGGAREIPPWDEEANQSGVLAAAGIAARAVIAAQGAVAACEAAVLALEDDPTFNAGTGAVLTAEGVAELDAALMDGATLDIGAVAALIGYRNPVRAARAMLREETVLLVGSGATRLAQSLNLDAALPFQPLSGDKGHDTVGAIVRDGAGNFAVAVSTGGLAGARAGRVGDSPLPGCGYYADNSIGAVCLSGDGERIARTLLAGRVMYALENGASPQRAADAGLLYLKRVGGEAGIIVMNRAGETGVAHNTSHFAVALQTEHVTRAQLKMQLS
jgi:L-asparaginase / beta-aspartyl-peptidase